MTPTRKWLHSLFLAVLVGGTALLYLPVLGFDFINLDDDAYVTDNPHVSSGLTSANVRWAWTAVHSANWHPLTWMSHQFDAALYGLRPAGHHLTNLLLHALNTVLLYALIALLTGACWRAFFVAALFAWHPMHIESVAWVAERKDVLSACFAWLTLLAYTGYARKPGFLKYLLVALLLACGLLAKQMLVTLPLILFVLDFWPLRRMANGRQALWRGLEKLPLLALAAGAAVAAFFAQQTTGAVQTLDRLSLSDRVGNAIISYARYAGKLFYPYPLAIPYPFADDRVTALNVAVAGAILVGGTLAALLLARRWPWFLAGWAFYGITLLPVIGIIQVGSQAMADRYTYIPYTGLFIILAWLAARLAGDPQPLAITSTTTMLARPFSPLNGVPESSRAGDVAPLACVGPIFEGGKNSPSSSTHFGVRQAFVTALAALSLIACIAATRAHLPVWQHSITLFRHSVAVTEENTIAHNNLGQALFAEGAYAEAGEHFSAALRAAPGNLDALNNYGVVLLISGKPRQAAEHFRAYLQEQPRDPDVRVNMAAALFQQGRLENAGNQARHALKLRPGFAKAQQLLNEIAAAERLQEE